MVSDEIYGKCGLRDTVNDAVVEGDSIEQQEHAETNHDDGKFPVSNDKDVHIMSQQGCRIGNTCIQKEAAEPEQNHQPGLHECERFQVPLVGGDENK